MKIDLITIFPTIRLETESWDNGEKIPDDRFMDLFHFCGSVIFSLRKLRSNPSILKPNQIEYVESISKEMIDSGSNPLDDFTIVYDKSVEVDGFDWLDSNGQRILTYLFMNQRLDYWTNPDFIKVMCFEEGGRLISHNNIHDHWVTIYRYLLPTEKDHIPKIVVNREVNGKLLAILESLCEKEPDFYARLMTSIGLFNQACRMNPTDENSSIVLLVSSFESLLQIPKYPKKESFSYALKLFWGFDDRIKDWAGDLYEVRNQVVHGAVIGKTSLLASKHHHYPHFRIAREIYHDSILLLLERKGLISVSPKYRQKTQENLKNMVYI
jgi:hypothetical protein